MNFNVNEYFVSFDYYDFTSDSLNVIIGNSPVSHAIRCVISWNGGFVSDLSYCSVADEYDRSYGEQLALERALTELTDDNELIGRFWEAYYG
jgi:hypothetical protein